VPNIAFPLLPEVQAPDYPAVNPERTSELDDRKVKKQTATKAEAVVSANPGCLLQLMSGLRRRGLRTIPTFHMVELLDPSIRNTPPDARG
jgi:glycolate oxidase iron-sulfur subunit